MYLATATTASGVFVQSRSAEIDEQYLGHFSDVTPVSQAPLWYTRSVRIVNELRELDANWDSYGSVPPTDAAHRTALRVLRWVPEVDLGAPHVAPVSGGGINLGWYFDRSRLDIEILPDGGVEYVHEEDGHIDDGSFARDHVSQVRDQLWQAAR